MAIVEYQRFFFVRIVSSNLFPALREIIDRNSYILILSLDLFLVLLSSKWLEGLYYYSLTQSLYWCGIVLYF